MKEKYIDSSLLDKAIVFAVNAHKNTERRGKGFPYIVHPMEVVYIVSTMTNDQEILAAAMLHDTVEDTDVTVEDIKREFGERIAEIVRLESDDHSPEFRSLPWIERKQIALDILNKAPLDCKMVALGDKLSNVRAMYYDYTILGDELWNKFRDKDKSHHAWRFNRLVEVLKPLEEFTAYKEFASIVDVLFNDAKYEKKIKE